MFFRFYTNNNLLVRDKAIPESYLAVVFNTSDCKSGRFQPSEIVRSVLPDMVKLAETPLTFFRCQNLIGFRLVRPGQFIIHRHHQYGGTVIFQNPENFTNGCLIVFYMFKHMIADYKIKFIVGKIEPTYISILYIIRKL